MHSSMDSLTMGYVLGAAVTVPMIVAERGRNFMRMVPSGNRVGVTTIETPISRCLSGSVSMDLSSLSIL